jgi:hypothetical protein
MGTMLDSNEAIALSLFTSMSYHQQHLCTHTAAGAADNVGDNDATDDDVAFT